MDTSPKIVWGHDAVRVYVYVGIQKDMTFDTFVNSSK